MIREYTSTVYIIKSNRTLLHFHEKFQKYLPPGGHVEKNETPVEAARREVLEECGLQIEFITDEAIHLSQPHAISLPRPYLCLLENIPAYKDEPPHQHIDFIYLAKPLDNEVPNKNFRWYSIEEVEQLSKRSMIFSDAKNILSKLLNQSASFITN